MDKQLIIDKMVDARKLTDEALGIAYGVQNLHARYELVEPLEQALDAIDALLNYLEDNSND